jgi:hypothetical protein
LANKMFETTVQPTVIRLNHNRFAENKTKELFHKVSDQIRSLNLTFDEKMVKSKPKRKTLIKNSQSPESVKTGGNKACNRIV